MFTRKDSTVTVAEILARADSFASDVLKIAAEFDRLARTATDPRDASTLHRLQRIYHDCATAILSR